MISITDEQFEQLRSVNAEINADPSCTPEPEQFRGSKYWAFPENMFPDSKDHALEKIRRLVQLGWPRGELKLTTCWTRPGDNTSYHAVVSIDCDRATLILDTLYVRVMPVDRMSYDWHMRETPGKGWVTVDVRP